MPSPPAIVTIFGKNLAASTESASTIPLPTKLAGTSVTVGGVLAPLFFVSPGQINIQMPTFFDSNKSVVVTTAAGSSDLVLLDFWYNFGIFTLDSSGCGRGLVLNVKSDGTVSLNSPTDSASPGDYISVFGTGIAVNRLPADGTPAPSNPPIPGVFHMSAELDSTNYSDAVTFTGLAPGLIGVSQVNVRIPKTVREGCGVPLRLRNYMDTASQPVPISIRSGGGPCIDPPSAGYAQITWEKAVVTGFNPSGTFETLTAALTASPGKQAPVVVPPVQGQRVYKEVQLGPFCSMPGYRSLDAGTVAAQVSGVDPIAASSAVQDHQTVYSATLPSGTIQPGTFQISATGGADVAAFQSSVHISSGINLLSSFQPGTYISERYPTRISWTGGDPDTWVIATLISHGGTYDRYYSFQSRTSTGSLVIDPYYDPKYNPLPFDPGLAGHAELVIEVTPDPSQETILSVPGLSLGGRHTWKYTYRFGGLNIG